MTQEIIELERRGWEALSTSGEAAARFYDEVLADEVLMLFPGGMIMDDRSKVVASMTGPPWSSFEISEERTFPVSDDVAIVAYRATTVRDGETYEALFNSTYVHQNGSWKLAFHQQTPI